MVTVTGFEAVAVELSGVLAQLSIGQAIGSIVGNPISVLLLLVGWAIIVFSSAVFGYLSLGAAANWVGSLIGSPGGRPPQRE